jgi:hypothetical protein
VLATLLTGAVLLFAGCSSTSGRISCSADSQCPGEMACVSGVCEGCANCATGERCLRAQCFAASCGDLTCPGAEVCLEEKCIAADCLGVVCAKDELCANGRCLPRACGTSECGVRGVCVGQECMTTECVGVSCASNGGEVCAAGKCLPRTCAGILCAEGAVCLGNVCVDALCVDVQCPGGTTCAAGLCFQKSCSSETCSAGFACANDQCVNVSCSNMACPSDKSFCEDAVCTACGPLTACGTLPEPSPLLTYSFETPLPAGGLPSAWTGYGPTPPIVVSSIGSSSSASLYLTDSSTTEISGVTMGVPTHARKVEFWFRPITARAEFRLNEHGNRSLTVLLLADGSLAYWTGPAIIPFTAPGTVAINGTWVKVSFIIHPGHSVMGVYLNDQFVGAAYPITPGRPVDQFEITFAEGVVTTGEFFVDDLSFSEGPAVDGFESSPLGGAPLGWTTGEQKSITVSGAPVFAGTKALLYNGTTPSRTGVSFGLGQRTLELWLNLSSGSAAFRLLSNALVPFGVMVNENGSVSYVSSQGAQVELAGPGVVPLNTWTKLRIEASSSVTTAAVYVNGSYIGSVPAASTVSSLSGYEISSGSSALTKFSVDNVHQE